mmetsp:Transcript_102775/g.209451  ORF Transcript_102775/g.209451 Transcript_102775/m.209451 type:complete len:80 (-) Transcript_102775:755-994(-)
MANQSNLFFGRGILVNCALEEADLLELILLYVHLVSLYLMIFLSTPHGTMSQEDFYLCFRYSLLEIAPCQLTFNQRHQK